MNKTERERERWKVENKAREEKILHVIRIVGWTVNFSQQNR